MIRELEISSQDGLSDHMRRVLICDRCPRWAFTTIYEVLVDGEIRQLCHHCTKQLAPLVGIDIRRPLSIAALDREAKKIAKVKRG